MPPGAVRARRSRIWTRIPTSRWSRTAATELRDGKVVASQLPPTTSPALVEWLLHLQNPLVWSSVMFRADAARRWPEMTRPELLYAEDFDLYHRLARHGRIARIDRELLTYRSHAGGASQQFTERMEQSAAAVLARMLCAGVRRRQRGRVRRWSCGT